MMLSLNNKVVLQAYEQGQGLKADVKSGFAMVAQKKNIVPLKVLLTTVLSDGTRIEAGSKAYLSEEELSTQAWAKQMKQIPDLLGDTPCILVDSKNVIFFSEEGSK